MKHRQLHKLAHKQCPLQNSKDGDQGGLPPATPYRSTLAPTHPTAAPRTIQRIGLLKVSWGKGVMFDIGDKLSWKHDETGSMIQNQAPKNCSSDGKQVCLNWENDRKLSVARRAKQDYPKYPNNDKVFDCFDIEWTGLRSSNQVLKDCFNLDTAHWYGGYEDHNQYWPFENNNMSETSFTPNDPFNPNVIGKVLERYFVSSNGVGIYIDNTVPLYFSLRTEGKGNMCFSASYKSYPYFNPQNSFPSLKYTLCYGPDVMKTHAIMANMFISKPLGIPNEMLFKYPIWSTWAEYKYGVNQTHVISYAQTIKKYNFPCSQIEIDDVWTPHYGDYVFDTSKFPNASEMIAKLHAMDYNVSVWVHPFFNADGKFFKEASSKGYLLKRTDSVQPEFTSWWNSNFSAVLDVTNPEATKWYLDKMDYLKTNYSVDSFKFDAGSLQFVPRYYNASNMTQNPCDMYPGEYVKMAAMSDPERRQEVRSGYRSQELPIFFRQIDKRSNWGHENGLLSIIPSAFTFGILGYPFVMADMVGGNAYDGAFPDTELFIRWTQLNTFLPVVQMSIGPWELNDTSYEGHNVTNLVRDFLELHTNISDDLISIANESVQTGFPIIRPLWWIEPKSEIALKCEDEFLVGDKWLVVPVLEQGARLRDVYIPTGDWKEVGVGNGTTFSGPQTVYNYTVQIHELAYFINVNKYNDTLV